MWIRYLGTEARCDLEHDATAVLPSKYGLLDVKGATRKMRPPVELCAASKLVSSVSSAAWIAAAVHCSDGHSFLFIHNHNDVFFTGEIVAFIPHLSTGSTDVLFLKINK